VSNPGGVVPTACLVVSTSSSSLLSPVDVLSSVNNQFVCGRGQEEETNKTVQTEREYENNWALAPPPSQPPSTIHNHQVPFTTTKYHLQPPNTIQAVVESPLIQACCCL
jgi:hypothetical protein